MMLPHSALPSSLILPCAASSHVPNGPACHHPVKSLHRPPYLGSNVSCESHSVIVRCDRQQPTKQVTASHPD